MLKLTINVKIANFIVKRLAKMIIEDRIIFL